MQSMKTYQFDLFFKSILLLSLLAVAWTCHPCYRDQANKNCPKPQESIDSYTLHMSVHPHLDAFWIFNFESYYDPKPYEGGVLGYFAQNKFSSVKSIFNTAKQVLWESKRYREQVSSSPQKAHRSFFNSEMGFFRRWYNEQTPDSKEQIKILLRTKYWQILGGGVVEHDEGCAYYDDIIQNYQIGLKFLKDELDYKPRVAVSADSFGHSQSTLAILAHLGIEGYFVERSDEHILLKSKTEFIWKAKSANGLYYGALPTHIRWAIHGFEDQFNPGMGQVCQVKENYINNLRNENEFLKNILKSSHIMRYFGHDFQRFDDYSYSVIEGMMQQFSREKCNKVSAVYGNPTEYFLTLMGQTFGKVKPVVTREQDIMPIWDYDSGLYWTGYYTTDPYHKKNYRDMGRYLHTFRKVFLPDYFKHIQDPTSIANYALLEDFAWQVGYLQHHDGVSGTSKYAIMDSLEEENLKMLEKIKASVLQNVFDSQFDKTTTVLFNCNLDEPCVIPASVANDIYIKILNSDTSLQNDPLIVELPFGKGSEYIPDCPYEVNCFCLEDNCPCKLYLRPIWSLYTSVILKRATKEERGAKVNRLVEFVPSEEYSNNATHFSVSYKGNKYSIGYKRVEASTTQRNYQHLSRFGTQAMRSFGINSGKYALGNNPNNIKDYSHIKKVYHLESPNSNFFLIRWSRHHMKTLITIPKTAANQFKVETISALALNNLEDVYLQIETPIANKNVFYTDSNGWLVMRRELYKHEDYEAHFSPQKFDNIDGNTYPVSAFIYIEDQSNKVSVNTDRPQGGIVYRSGTIWLNFDRITSDDGKWVYETTYRSEYQHFTHRVTVENKDYSERRFQRIYDQPRLVQASEIQGEKVTSEVVDVDLFRGWNQISNLDGLKMLVRPYNDSNVVVRVHNLHDKEARKVGLFSNVNKISLLLTNYYAATVQYETVKELSLGGNMDYEEFISAKWNWHETVDLKSQNSIFDKDFQEMITLRPLQIRTFVFTKVVFSQRCTDIGEVSFDYNAKKYRLNTMKPSPKRLSTKEEADVIDYLLNGDHCLEESPVVKPKPLGLPVVDVAVLDTVVTSVDVELLPQQKRWALPDKTLHYIITKSDKPEKTSTPQKDVLHKIQNLIFANAKISTAQKLMYFNWRLKEIKHKRAA